MACGARSAGVRGHTGSHPASQPGAPSWGAGHRELLLGLPEGCGARGAPQGECQASAATTSVFISHPNAPGGGAPCVSLIPAMFEHLLSAQPRHGHSSKPTRDSLQPWDSHTLVGRTGPHSGQNLRHPMAIRAEEGDQAREGSGSSQEARECLAEKVTPEQRPRKPRAQAIAVSGRGASAPGEEGSGMCKGPGARKPRPQGSRCGCSGLWIGSGRGRQRERWLCYSGGRVWGVGREQSRNGGAREAESHRKMPVAGGEVQTSCLIFPSEVLLWPLDPL